MTKPLQDKVAVITGSSRGIGAEIARSLAGAGAKVIVNYAGNREAADAVCAAITNAGGESWAVKADVSDPIQVRMLFDAAIERFKRLDILVNNAGVLLSKKIAEIGDEEFDGVLSINVKGIFYALREAATRMADGGRVISLSSTVTRLMLPGYGAYAASKGAVEQLTRVFAREVGERGITANIVSPGPVNTEMFNTGKSEETIKRMAAMSFLGRVGEPEDIARVVLFLASDGAGWVTGQNISASGGAA
ncbi:3-oxoacyl-[acyl-carrier protein] reductase [Nitrosospira briensis]|uniref:3-oxoacyl-[acyl-carrier protein] reductase n=1 Tax=Nitrosospira briensis TaxID=35799 RepID=A0A1I4YCE3_9PROT|nr:SDR family oxidoreductase [Nitrosospira briensis]SFN35698.1 3-oxoacyl-[acyl-carrier protein] reductase [Nitrosospira briensis]